MRDRVRDDEIEGERKITSERNRNLQQLERQRGTSVNLREMRLTDRSPTQRIILNIQSKSLRSTEELYQKRNETCT